MARFLSSAVTFISLIFFNTHTHAFTPASLQKLPTANVRGLNQPTFWKVKSTSLSMVDPSLFSDKVESANLIAYSDDPLGDLLFGANGIVIAGIIATFAAIGVGFVSFFEEINYRNSSFYV